MTGWGGLGAVKGVDVPKNVLVVDHVPHAWLFPRCCAVVHHGGAGALHTVLAIMSLLSCFHVSMQMMPQIHPMFISPCQKVKMLAN